VTGLRVSELLAVKWEDVDPVAGEIRLTRAIVGGRTGCAKERLLGSRAGHQAWCPYRDRQTLARDGFIAIGINV
jgi:integrase